VTVMVTGAAGHIGANLVRALLARGRPVSALVHRDRRALEGLDIRQVEGDILDPPSLRRAFEGAEVVYHLAAHISIRRADWPLLESINVTGTRNVVEACLDCGVRRLIHFSSIHALIQEPLEAPLDESRPLAESRRHPPYDRSKAAGQRQVLKGIDSGLEAVIIHPTAVIGPYDYGPSHFGQALLALGHGRLPALVAGGFDWVDARDVSEGAIRAEEGAPNGARYLLSGHWLSLREVATMVEELTGTHSPRLVVPVWLARMGLPFALLSAHLTGKRPLYTSVSLEALRSNRDIRHERATGELGYHPRPFRETLADTLRWFERAGYLTRPVAAPSTGAE
jgi:dihydroflavonol-4-reductase